ncbi:hypothetical protein L1887_05426 [Cichorium endivia]|nr:hypothetical protein L1887_05426 [Cichorium endivia]
MYYYYQRLRNNWQYVGFGQTVLCLSCVGLGSTLRLRLTLLKQKLQFGGTRWINAAYSLMSDDRGGLTGSVSMVKS